MHKQRDRILNVAESSVAATSWPAPLSPGLFCHRIIMGRSGGPDRCPEQSERHNEDPQARPEHQAIIRGAGVQLALTLSVKSSPGFYRYLFGTLPANAPNALTGW
jgi:hypothetical protein